MQKLTWDDFTKLGIPENVPDEIDNSKQNELKKMPVYVHYEKKGRGGKEAVIIKGIDGKFVNMDDIAKTIKNKLGVGGTVKDMEIIISGNKRDKIIAILQEFGFKNIKKAGA
ncbi:MAG TPA: translation initiation factor [Saprospiraceae bacterium]|nr:translation initiation factor [Saprospiraceae bacterium]